MPNKFLLTIVKHRCVHIFIDLGVRMIVKYEILYMIIVKIKGCICIILISVEKK